MSASEVDRSKALYNLHQDEKRQEERTRRIIEDLAANSKDMATARMRLIEKLLDVTVKDEIGRKVAEGRKQHMTDLNDQAIRQSAQSLMEAQVKSNTNSTRSVFGDNPFVAALDRLVNTSEEVSKAEVKDAVSRYVRPQIDAALTAKKRANGAPNILQGVAAAVATARRQHHKDIEETVGFRDRSEVGDRRRRVQEATRMLKKDIGDLTPLLYVTPVEYKTDIGKSDAEIISLRKKFASLCAEGDKLLQERRVQENLIATEEAKLTAEAETACQQLVVLERELETRTMDMKEIRDASDPKTGEWASNTIRIENELAQSKEAEHLLRGAAEEARRENAMLKAECTLLKQEVEGGVDELNRMHLELQEAQEQLEKRVTGDKTTLYKLREQQVADTRQINALRHRMLHRREDIRRQKREDRGVINTILAQVGVERELQSVISAMSIELQRRAEMLHIQTDHHIGSLAEKKQNVDGAIKNMNETIRQLAIKIANYQSAVENVSKTGKGSKLTAAQHMHYQERQVAAWEREENDAASTVAEAAARVDLNTRQNDFIMRQIAELMVLQEDVRSEGVDITRSNDDDLQFIRRNLYTEASQRRYQESKYDQTTFLLRERIKARDEGKPIMPLTRNRRIALSERRSRRAALNKAKADGEAALQHIRSGNFHNNTVGGNDINTSGTGLNDDSNQPDTFRMMVVQFIKNEIQPLYDSNQITKRRFVDLVSRVSAWFVGTRRPTKELSEADISVLTRKIQETLTWQDEERQKQRSASRASNVLL